MSGPDPWWRKLLPRRRQEVFYCEPIRAINKIWKTDKTWLLRFIHEEMMHRLSKCFANIPTNEA
jgi:hypothetical protein